MQNNEQLIITKAENGFIIGGGDTAEVKNRTQVAKTLDEVVTIISAIINPEPVAPAEPEANG